MAEVANISPKKNSFQYKCHFSILVRFYTQRIGLFRKKSANKNKYWYQDAHQSKLLNWHISNKSHHSFEFMQNLGLKSLKHFKHTQLLIKFGKLGSQFFILHWLKFESSWIKFFLFSSVPCWRANFFTKKNQWNCHNSH